MTIRYKINMFPACCKTWQSCEKRGLTSEGVTIYLRNLLRDAEHGYIVKGVTISND
jgi:hypothetical protein